MMTPYNVDPDVLPGDIVRLERPNEIGYPVIEDPEMYLGVRTDPWGAKAVTLHLWGPRRPGRWGQYRVRRVKPPGGGP